MALALKPRVHGSVLVIFVSPSQVYCACCWTKCRRVHEKVRGSTQKHVAAIIWWPTRRPSAVRAARCRAPPPPLPARPSTVGRRPSPPPRRGPSSPGLPYRLPKGCAAVAGGDRTARPRRPAGARRHRARRQGHAVAASRPSRRGRGVETAALRATLGSPNLPLHSPNTPKSQKESQGPKYQVLCTHNTVGPPYISVRL